MLFIGDTQNILGQCHFRLAIELTHLSRMTQHSLQPFYMLSRQIFIYRILASVRRSRNDQCADMHSTLDSHHNAPGKNRKLQQL
ncbi:hypothetical protein PMIT1327_02214 [Prochlorococcus marinus str. MIT 1327]|nr:hypothetical protein PMIT1312_01887 [Prochlorococcus marinus str. MIT 1312]KZR79008.1 hypothetical protein PMIT1327_02214 [Prochlorococcus marinus str. MIT 1327]